MTAPDPTGAALAPDDCSRPWTMADLRTWVQQHAHTPADQEVRGILPEFPRDWARGNPEYANTLLGLDVLSDFLTDEEMGIQPPPATDPTTAQVLALPIGRNELDATTVGEWLVGRLGVLWTDGYETIGDSGEVVVPLIKAGYVAGRVDEDGYIDGYDVDQLARVMGAAIRALLPASAAGASL